MSGRPWPRDPNDAPTATQIARAYVAAARQMGDLERLRDAAQGLGPYNHLTTRARWVALEALTLLYPKCGLPRLASKLGVKAQNNPASCLGRAREAGWWSVAAVNDVVKAI